MAITESIYDISRSTLALIKSWLGGDERVNDTAILDEDTNIDAPSWNKKVAGLAEVAKRTRPGNLVPYTFSQADCVASQSSVDLAREGAYDANRKDVTAWRDGSVVGLTVHVENARTAGTLTIHWKKNGVAQTMTVVIDDTDTQKNRSYQLPGVETFSAKDLLRVAVTTDASWAAGTTPSVSVDLIASYGEEEDS